MEDAVKVLRILDGKSLILFKNPERVEWHKLGARHPLMSTLKDQENKKRTRLWETMIWSGWIEVELCYDLCENELGNHVFCREICDIVTTYSKKNRRLPAAKERDVTF